MDSFGWFFGLLGLCAIFAVPIATLFLCLGIRRRQDELTRQVANLHREVLGRASQAKTSEAAPVPAPMPVTAKPPPIAVPLPVPVAPAPVPAAPPPLPKTELLQALSQRTTASPPPKPQATPSAFQSSVREIFTRIWNWICVGEEYRKPGMSVEFAVATNWLVRIGVLIVVVGIGFFIDYSSKRMWLGPLAKVSLSLLVGSGLLVTGIRLLGKRYNLIGQGLLGAGFATWYGSLYAAFIRFGLLQEGSTFLLMALVTAGAGFVAVRFNSLLVALIGFLGGYGTPLLLGTNTQGFVGYYAYILMLGAGILGIAHRRDWRLLNLLAFAATQLILFISLARRYQPENFWEVLPFLFAFFMLFSTLVFLHQIRHGRKTTVLDLSLLFLNAGLFFLHARALVFRSPYAREWVAGLSLFLAAFYILHLLEFLRRKGRDRGLAVSFTALASFFLILTLPILLSGQSLTLAWSVLALVLLWVAGKMDSSFLHQVSFGLYALVFLRFLGLDLLAEFQTRSLERPGGWAYARALVERAVDFGVPILSMALGMRLVRTPSIADPHLAMDSANDLRPFGRRPVFVVAATLLFAMCFLYLQLELNRTWGYLYDPLRLPMLTAVWVLATLVLLNLFLKHRREDLMVLTLAFVAGTLIKIWTVDLVSWGFSASEHRYFSEQGYSFLDAGMRLLDHAMVLAFFLHAFRLFGKRGGPPGLREAFGYGGLVLLLAYSTFEVNSLLHAFLPDMQSGGLSVYWGLFALSLVSAGLSRRIRTLRMAGLVLFLVVAIKVFFVDLASLSPLYKIVAFILLGLVLLAGAFAYLKFSDRFDADKAPDAPA